jgi:hypothetical protein
MGLAMGFASSACWGAAIGRPDGGRSDSDTYSPECYISQHFESIFILVKYLEIQKVEESAWRRPA